MKLIFKRPLTIVILLLSLSTALLSFSTKKGGEGFEVYLNNKLLLQQYGSKLNSAKTLHLDQLAPSDVVQVKYTHCSEVGKGRTLLIKDAQNKVLKEWHFKDVLSGQAVMTCSGKDILQLQDGKRALTLYYASSELPQGRLLAIFDAGS